MNRVQHYAEYLAALFVGYAMRPLPRRARLALGRTVGGIVFVVDAKHRAVTLHNLDFAFGSSKTADEKYAIARGAFRHFGAMIFELISFGRPRWEKLQKMVEFEGVENLENARRRGKGVLLVSSHFGNWELHGIAHGYRFGPIAVVARGQDNPHFNQWLEQIRTYGGNTVLYKQRALQRVMRLMKDGESVAVVTDQNVSKEDALFIDFFGKKAATTPVASWIALKTGAALVPVFALPLSDGRYRMIYEKPIYTGAYQNVERRRAIELLTQECAEVQEGYVRRNPEFWLWQHRRWKTRPPEERSEEGSVAEEEAS